jgi:hypothetical protein
MAHEDRRQESSKDRLTVDELATLTGLGRGIIRRLIALEVIDPDIVEPEPRFRPETVVRVQKIRRLHVELGVSWSSMPLVLDLLDRIDYLEARIKKE